jgi:hypothetical protein
VTSNIGRGRQWQLRLLGRRDADVIAGRCPWTEGDYATGAGSVSPAIATRTAPIADQVVVVTVGGIAGPPAPFHVAPASSSPDAPPRSRSVLQSDGLRQHRDGK